MKVYMVFNELKKYCPLDPEIVQFWRLFKIEVVFVNWSDKEIHVGNVYKCLVSQ